MAQAGTMMGGSAQTKQSGSPWPAMALAIAVIVATIAGVWLASSAGLVRGTAKPVADGSYDQYLNGILDRAHAAPYAGVAVTPAAGGSLERAAYLNGILDRAHATPFAGGSVALSYDEYLNVILDRAHATPNVDSAITQSYDAYLNGILDRAHAAPFAVGAVRLPLIVGSSPIHPGKEADQLLTQTTPQSPTSGTFHPGKEADQRLAQVKRNAGPGR